MHGVQSRSCFTDPVTVGAGEIRWDDGLSPFPREPLQAGVPPRSCPEGLFAFPESALQRAPEAPITQKLGLFVHSLPCEFSLQILSPPQKKTRTVFFRVMLPRFVRSPCPAQRLSGTTSTRPHGCWR